MRNVIAFFLATLMCVAIVFIASHLFLSNMEKGKYGDEGASVALTVSQSDCREALYRFRFSLNDEEYSLPCQYSLFEKNGWVLRNPAEEIEGCSNLTGVYIKKSHRSLKTEIINYSSDAIMCCKGEIHSILANLCEFDRVNIHGALVFDRATTPRLVRQTLGYPDEFEENSEKITLRYIKSEHQNISFVFYKTRQSGSRDDDGEETDCGTNPLASGYYNQCVVFECRKNG